MNNDTEYLTQQLITYLGNKRALLDFIGEGVKSKYVIISFNSEGFITVDQMRNMLEEIGKLYVLETKYNVFRGSRNLVNREIHVKEYLYLLEK
jgi:adenine-specific DNA-methyltransferase